MRCSPLQASRHHLLKTKMTSHQLPESAVKYHEHAVGPNQCTSVVIQQINAPISIVWSLVRKFDNPQSYKHFIKSCYLIAGDGDVGTLREVSLVSGLPAVNSTERLEILDEEHKVLSFRVVGGDHRLTNYKSVTSLHPSPDLAGASLVVESYVVDVPPGNSPEDTCVFVDTIVRCNLLLLARISENLARQGPLNR